MMSLPCAHCDRSSQPAPIAEVVVSADRLPRVSLKDRGLLSNQVKRLWRKGVMYRRPGGLLGILPRSASPPSRRRGGTHGAPRTPSKLAVGGAPSVENHGVLPDQGTYLKTWL